MAIYNTSFKVPSDIAIGIAKGDYKIFGGVVRSAKDGAIVKHLKEVKNVKEKRAVIIAAGAIGVAALTGGVMYLVDRTKNKLSYSFDKCFRKYLSLIEEQKVDTECINEMLIILDELKSKNKSLKIQIKPEEFDKLMTEIKYITSELVKEYAKDIDIEKAVNDDNIISLENYLRIQKQILDKAA